MNFYREIFLRSQNRIKSNIDFIAAAAGKF